MNIFHITGARKFTRLDTLEAMPETGLVWIDWVRDEASGWEAQVEQLIGVTVEPHHVVDSHNAQHPSFFDGTSEYDLFIFQGLGPESEPFPLETRTASFFLFDRLVVTVRAVDNISFGIVQQRLETGRARVPGSAVSVMHLVLDTMVDRYLSIREPLTNRLVEIQDALLDPDDPSGDWKQLLRDRRAIGKLDMLCEAQLEALDAYRRNARQDLTQQQAVRMRDLEEHVNRVLNHVQGLQRDIESAVQLHFSAVAHSTNQTVNRLTVISAVFLPLSLLAGIWGMNFEYMPELKFRYAYFVALGLLLTVGASLLVVFKRRGMF